VDPSATIGGGAQSDGDAMGTARATMAAPSPPIPFLPIPLLRSRCCSFFFAGLRRRWAPLAGPLNTASQRGLIGAVRWACGAGISSGLAAEPAPLAYVATDQGVGGGERHHRN
jgi:hypothetical protein